MLEWWNSTHFDPVLRMTVAGEVGKEDMASLAPFPPSMMRHDFNVFAELVLCCDEVKPFSE